MAEIEWDETSYRYVQLAAIIRERIRAGVYPPQTKLSEVAFEQEFGVSRPTVRQAMAILREEGLIVTLKGKGSIVTGRGDVLG